MRMVRSNPPEFNDCLCTLTYAIGHGTERTVTVNRWPLHALRGTLNLDQSARFERNVAPDSLLPLPPWSPP